MGRIRDDAYVSSSTPGGATGCEVCRLRLLCIDWLQCVSVHLSHYSNSNFVQMPCNIVFWSRNNVALFLAFRRGSAIEMCWTAKWRLAVCLASNRSSEAQLARPVLSCSTQQKQNTLRYWRNLYLNWSFQFWQVHFTDHFSGSARAIGRECVCLCFLAITFE